MTTNERIQRHVNKAYELAAIEVKELAAQTLRGCPELDKFFMGMGTWFFIDKQGNNITDSTDFRFVDVFNFLLEWDDFLCITGESVEISRNEALRFDY